MAWRALGPDRLNLVTDAVAALGLDAGTAPARRGRHRRRRRRRAQRRRRARRQRPGARSGRAQPRRVHRVHRRRGRGDGHVDAGAPARARRPGPAGGRRRGPTSPCSTPSCTSSPRSSAGRWRGGRDRRRPPTMRRASSPASSSACCDRTAGAGHRPGDRELADRRLPRCSSRSTAPAGSASPRASAVLLDEYVGLRARPSRGATGRSSDAHLVDHVDLPRDRLYGPDVWAEDLAGAVPALRGLLGRARRRRRAAARHRLRRPHRLQRARLVARSRTRIKTLTDATRADNARFFAIARRRPAPRRDAGAGDDRRGPPPRCWWRTGAAKAAPIARRRRGTADGDVPGVGAPVASARHRRGRRGRGRPGSQLAEYYRSVYAGKPAWQQLLTLRSCGWRAGTCRPSGGRDDAAAPRQHRPRRRSNGFRLALHDGRAARPRHRPAELVARTSGTTCVAPPAGVVLGPGRRLGARRWRAGTDPATPTTGRRARSSSLDDGSTRAGRGPGRRARRSSARSAAGAARAPPDRPASDGAAAWTATSAARDAPAAPGRRAGAVDRRRATGVDRRRSTTASAPTSHGRSPPARMASPPARSTPLQQAFADARRGARAGAATVAGRPIDDGRRTSGAASTSTSPASSSRPPTSSWLIDVAAWRGLNRVHLHLTDDEAWRVPIDGYPALTDVGAWRGHGLAIPPLLGSGAGAVRRVVHARRDRRLGRAGRGGAAS